MTEAEFATQFEGDSKRPGLFQLGGWQWTHFRTALDHAGYRTALSGDKGFPDYVATRIGPLRNHDTHAGECIFIEIKGTKGRVSPEQKEWHRLLRAAGQRVHVWWPEDSEEAKEVLVG